MRVASPIQGIVAAFVLPFTESLKSCIELIRPVAGGFDLLDLFKECFLRPYRASAVGTGGRLPFVVPIYNAIKAVGASQDGDHFTGHGLCGA
jgi:hypothetical protein